MGCKRPMDSEVPELPFKHSKVSVKEDIRPSLVGALDEFTRKPDMSVGGEHCIDKYGWRIGETKVSETEFPESPDKDVETNTPLSWVTTSSSDEDRGYDSLYPDCFAFGLPARRLELPPGDIRDPSMDAPPRKEVPIGPDHQATLPEISTCTLELSKNEKFIGTCIIPTSSPKFSSADAGAGVGRTVCFCLDKGSVRCVRQHVMEAREKLRREFGEEVFEKLGFYDMGEVVAARWSDEEQQLFHQVVFSNPYILNRNFWKQLSVAFPSRSKNEIVSYYYNVFMLQRRAAQNRSNFLEIDSDDDEWHGSSGNSCETEVAEYDDLGNESSTDVEDQTQCEEISPNEDYDDSDDDNYFNNDRDGDPGKGVIVATEKDIGINNYSDASTEMSSEEGRVNSTGQHEDKTSGGYFGIQDDSGTSFEFNMDDSCGTDDAIAGSQVRGDETYHTGCLSGRIDDFSNGVNQHPYMFDPCDAKIWDSQYQSGPSKDADLLPTSNMIEEIFGQGSWDDSK